MKYEVTIDKNQYRLDLEQTEKGWQCHLNGREVRLDAVLTRPDVLSVLIAGKAYEIKRERTAMDLHLWVGPVRYAAELHDPRSFRGRKSMASDDTGPRKLLAPMPGKVVRLLVAEKQEVETGQGILVVEAMKMQNEIKSPKKGIVQKIAVREGDSVNPADVLAIVA
jgi:biotin carboxyl carrier protein